MTIFSKSGDIPTHQYCYVERSSYPGGKSGAGIYQRLINLIPRHRILIVPFAGHCGVIRNIRPAEHTIVVDRDPSVCQWWLDWSRTKKGRRLEIHNCDGIEFIRYRFGVTEYSAPPGSDAAGGVDRSTTDDAAEAFLFADPPYVMSERAGKRIYQCELTDEDHQRLLGTVTQLDASRYRMMICGYACALYSPLDNWFSINHRVPTRGGPQDERIWMNYPKPVLLHDHQYIGDSRRSRERIRRRQKNWRKQLERMSLQERTAMLEVLSSTRRES